MAGIVFAAQSCIVSFLLLRPAQCEQRRPEQNNTHSCNGFIIRCCLVQASTQLNDTRLDSLYLTAQLFTVIGLVLHWRNVCDRDILREALIN